MIGKLKGVVEEIETDHLIVDVHGVGYEVFASTRTLQRLPSKGEALTLHIETVVREDSFTLYGFPDPAEKQAFRLLQTVQGVGARVALAILSVAAPSEIESAIARQDKTAFTRAPGVGPKLAERLIRELKDKVFGGAADGFAPQATGMPVAPGVAVGRDAISALTNLGYKPVEAQGAIARVLAGREETPALGELMRLALRELSQ